MSDVSAVAVWDEATGNIVSVVRTSYGNAKRQKVAGQRITYFDPTVEVATNTHYVSDLIVGTISPKQSMGLTLDKAEISADGLDASIISNLPVASEVVIAGPTGSSTVVVDDGELAITCAVPGQIRVRVIPPVQFLEESYILHAL